MGKQTKERKGGQILVFQRPARNRQVAVTDIHARVGAVATSLLAAAHLRARHRDGTGVHGGSWDSMIFRRSSGCCSAAISAPYVPTKKT
jgi:hypothetical protein